MHRCKGYGRSTVDVGAVTNERCTESWQALVILGVELFVTHRKWEAIVSRLFDG